MPLHRPLRNKAHNQSCCPPRARKKQTYLTLGCSLREFQADKTNEKDMKSSPRAPDGDSAISCDTGHTGHRGSSNKMWLHGCHHHKDLWHLSQQQLPDFSFSWLQLFQDAMEHLSSLFPFSNVIKIGTLHTCKMTFVQGYSLRHCSSKSWETTQAAINRGLNKLWNSLFPMNYYCGYKTNEKALYAVP